MHPADIAELFQSLDLKQAEWFFELIPDREMKADVLMELDEEERKEAARRNGSRADRTFHRPT